MAAYSAVACFQRTLKQLLNSSVFPFDFSDHQIQFLHSKVSALESTLDKMAFVPKKWRKDMNELQTRIRNAIYAAQDKVEYSISKGRSSEKSDEIPLKEIVAHVDHLAEEAEKMAEEIINDPQVQNLFSENPEPFKLGSRRDTIVGQEKAFKTISDQLTSEDKRRVVIPITGIPGIGKTTLARCIYDNQEMIKQFNIRAWVTVSQEYNFQEIFSNILSSMESKNYSAGHYAKQGDEQTLLKHLYQELYNLKYLIVVDDVWDAGVWDRIKQALPDEENGSRVLLTTRIHVVANYVRTSGFILEMEPLGPNDVPEKYVDMVTNRLRSEDKQRVVIAVTGMPSCKTTLARSIYDNEEKMNQFNIRAWVTIPQEYNFQEIFSKILSSMESKNYSAGHYAKQGDEQTLLNHIHQELYKFKYLIVVEDVWDAGVWDRIKQALPDKENGSRVLLTTRIPAVANYVRTSGFILEMEPRLTTDNLKKYLDKVTNRLLSEDKQRVVIAVTGMPSCSKTTLARSIYDNEEKMNQFNIRAWVTIPQEYNFQEIFSKILSSMESKNYSAGHYAKQGDEQTLLKHIHQELSKLKYLIVIDDAWDARVWDRVKQALPDNKNGSRILLTTSIPKVASYVQSGFVHEMQPLGPEDSWKLLCYKVFGDTDKACPPHLRNTGWSIAEKCNGLPLSLTVVGGLLLQERERIEYWTRIKEDTADAAAKGDDAYLEILSLSYNYLPGKLKGCFLYMGAFPEDSEIRVSKLIKLWVAEGFLKLSPTPQSPLIELVAQRSLEDLIDRNLISVRRRSSNGGVKVCSMHESLRKLAEIESGIEKFFHSRKRYKQMLGNDTQSQRRVSVHRNILMCLEDVFEETKKITYARSLLHVGPLHHHPLPFILTFDLLRVLDAFTVYFIDFPHEFIQLVHLRYLSFTYNEDISPEIVQLRKLEVLMVRREPKIIFVGVSFLPDEIWEMPQLRHLWFTETDFPALPPNIPEYICLLADLQTLANVNAAFFTDEVLDNMPNLRKLVMWIESPDKLGFSLKKLSKLESFKFVVMNPIPGKGITVEAEDLFPRTLKRLNLSGCGLPWEYMEFIANELKDLEVLKLRELAFDGDEWSLDYKFKNLKFLLIEYLGFKTWKADESHFQCLERLILRHCYELEGIPSDLGSIGPLKLLELVDCSPAAVKSAKVIRTEHGAYNKDFQVRIFSSWE